VHPIATLDHFLKNAVPQNGLPNLRPFPQEFEFHFVFTVLGSSVGSRIEVGKPGKV
jgi:hypothetical protein